MSRSDRSARSSGPLARVRRRHRESLRASLARLRERPLSHGFAIALLSIALLALLLLRLGGDQLSRFASPLAGARTISLFLQPQMDEQSVQKLAGRLAADERLSDVSTISPEAGLRELAHVDGSTDALAELPENPLPWVIAVEPRGREVVDELLGEWRQQSEIEYIADESEWRQRADVVMRSARIATNVIAALIVLATLMIVANAVRTIRVEGAGERSLQRIFGATESDLRRPYVYLGALYGAIAGALALLMAVILALLLMPMFQTLNELFNPGAHDTSRGLWWLIVIVPIAIVFGALGAWLGCLFERDVEPVE